MLQKHDIVIIKPVREIIGMDTREERTEDIPFAGSIFLKGMRYFCTRKAQVIEASTDASIVTYRLSIDNGRHWWPREVLEKSYD